MFRVCAPVRALVPLLRTVDRCVGRLTVHRQGAHVQRRLNDAIGRLLLRVAAVLHRRVASKPAWRQWQLRRNDALRAAHRRGLTVEEMATRLGLTQGWVREKLNETPPEPAAVEEAA